MLITRILPVLVLILPLCAHAQQKQTFVIKDGKLVGGAAPATGGTQAQGGGKQLVIAQDQQLMFHASASLLKKDYPTAEKLYSQAIALNGYNIEAYLQRGFVRREMGNTTGVNSDARTAIHLANNAIQRTPRDPDLYYQRSMALRLIRQFDHARKDVLTALQLGGKSSLRNDLNAIELERKIANTQAQMVR